MDNSRVKKKEGRHALARWCSTVVLVGAAVLSTSMPAEAMVALSGARPGLQGVFAHKPAPDAVRWILMIDGPLPGVDYHAFFGVVIKDSTRAGATEIVL
jgi:hypothetical protein